MDKKEKRLQALFVGTEIPAARFSPSGPGRVPSPRLWPAFRTTGGGLPQTPWKPSMYILWVKHVGLTRLLLDMYTCIYISFSIFCKCTLDIFLYFAFALFRSVVHLPIDQLIDALYAPTQGQFVDESEMAGIMSSFPGFELSMCLNLQSMRLNLSSVYITIAGRLRKITKLYI